MQFCALGNRYSTGVRTSPEYTTKPRLSEEELGTRLLKARRARVLDRFSTERAQRVRLETYELETSGHDTV